MNKAIVRALCAGAFGIAIAAAGPCSAQELNSRTKASPSTDSQTAQVVAEARLKAQEAEQRASLLANHVTNGAVDTSCNMQVGGEQADKQAGAPKTLVGKSGGVNTQNTTVVLGSTVLLCQKP